MNKCAIENPWQAVHQVSADHGGYSDRQACAAGTLQAGGSPWQAAYQVSVAAVVDRCGRPVAESIDSRDILLINKSEYGKRVNAHRILTNTTGVIGGMAEAIISNPCPWWNISRGLIF